MSPCADWFEPDGANIKEKTLVGVRYLGLKLEFNIYHLCDFGKIIALLSPVSLFVTQG